VEAPQRPDAALSLSLSQSAQAEQLVGDVRGCERRRLSRAVVRRRDLDDVGARKLDSAQGAEEGERLGRRESADLEGARELGFTVVPSEELRALGPEGYGRLVRERVGERPAFLSFDVDFLDPAFAPGTGTPEIAGFSTAEAVGFLRALRGIRLAGCDVVEVSPPYDGPGQRTALAAANVAWELLALRALGGAP